MTWVPSCTCETPTKGKETGPSKSNSTRPYQQWYCAVCDGVFTAPRSPALQQDAPGGET